MDNACLSCGINSNDVILLACSFKGEDVYVCIKCLPALIHGSH